MGQKWNEWKDLGRKKKSHKLSLLSFVCEYMFNDIYYCYGLNYKQNFEIKNKYLPRILFENEF